MFFVQGLILINLFLFSATTGLALGFDHFSTGFTSATVTSAADELVIQNVLTLKKRNAWKKPGIGSSSGKKILKFTSARTMIQFCKSIGTSDTWWTSESKKKLTNIIAPNKKKKNEEFLKEFQWRRMKEVEKNQPREVEVEDSEISVN